MPGVVVVLDVTVAAPLPPAPPLPDSRETVVPAEPPVIVVPPPPGRTQVQVGFVLQGKGPFEDVQVVVWPVQVTDAGQLEIVIMLVEVIVELPYVVGLELGVDELLDSE